MAVSVAEAAPAEEEEEITLTAAEEAAAMEVFALLDVNNSGFIEHNEVDVLFGGAANRWRVLFRWFVSVRCLFWSPLKTSSAHSSTTALHLILALTRSLLRFPQPIFHLTHSLDQ